MASWQQYDLAGDVVERSSHSLSWADGACYLLGGEHQARVPIDSTLWRWKPNQSEWERVSVKGTAPSPRVAHAQAIVRASDQTSLYVFGGRAGIHMNEEPMQDLFRCDLSSGSWEQIDASNAPSARSFHQMVSVGTDLFVFGGCSAEGRMNDLHRFDTVTRTWSALPAHEGIAGRGGATFQASPQGDRLFVIGGFSGEERNDIWVFDLSTSTWSPVEAKGDTLRPRSVCSSGALCMNNRNLLVIFGGEVNPSEKGHEGAGGFLNDLILFDCDTFELSTPELATPNQPPCRGWASGCVDNTSHTFYLFGGLAGNDQNPLRLDDMWACGFSN